jgi:signal peptidase I
MDFKEEQEPFKVIDTKEKAEVGLDEEIIPVEETKTPEDKKEKKEKNLVREIMNYLLIIVIAFFSATLIQRYVFSQAIVKGESMQPTLHNNDILILWQLGDVKRDDVIVFQPVNEPDPFIKRIIGVPGDTLKIDNQGVYLNGEYMESCSIIETYCQQNKELVIPDGHYFVMGDNRNNSTDSRKIGLIKKDQIIGEAVFRLKGGFGFIR